MADECVHTRCNTNGVRSIHTVDWSAARRATAGTAQRRPACCAGPHPNILPEPVFCFVS